MTVAGEHAVGARPRDTDALRAYAVVTLVDHLVQAGRRDAVHDLLGKVGPEGPAWYGLKQRSDDDSGFERDVGLAWRLADGQFREACDDAERARSIGLQARYALITASLEQLADRLSPDDVRRHVVSGEWSMSRARAMASRVSDPIARSRMLAALAGVGDDSDVRAVVTTALADANPEVALAAVTERLPAEKLILVVVAARAIGGEDALANALASAAARLPTEDIEPLLREAMGFTSHMARARAVVALAAKAPAGLIDEVVLETGLLDDDEVALDLLEAQPAALSPGVAGRSLEVLQRLPASKRRTDVAAVLLDAVDPVSRTKALKVEQDAARRIRALDQRSTALARLGLDAEAFRVALEVSSAHRGDVIAAIAPHLSPAVAGKAVKALKGIESRVARGEALLALAPLVEPSATLTALQVLETVRPERMRAQLVAILAPQLPDARLTYALRLALEIRDPEVRHVAVAALETRLTDRHRSTPLYRRRAGRRSGVGGDAAARMEHGGDGG